MRIRKLRFHNINNLKGTHEIDFISLPLKAAGIFAITGPTGAGKSTILDVITLALFNRIPRFKKAISKGEMQGLGSILTHHTTEASASIEYEIRGQVYVSSWNVSKAKRTGNLKDYEMSLMDATGTYMDLKRSEVPAKNEEIIGLKYDQFVKSIILSQGEFSKFLKADKNERGQLLENLTGTSIYRKIGAKAFQKFKEVNESAKLERARLEDIQVLTVEEREAIEAEIENTKAALSTFDKKLAALETLEKVKRDLVSIRRELVQNQEEKQKLNEQAANLKAQNQRLDLHEKLSPAAGDLKLHHQITREIGEAENEIDQKKSKLSEARKSLEGLLSEHHQLTGAAVEVANFHDLLNNFEQEVLALDREKEESLKRGKEQRQRINQLKTSSDLPLGEKVRPNEALDLIKEQQKALRDLIRQAQLKADADMATAKSELKIQRQQNEVLKEILANLQLTAQAHQALELSKKQQEETKDTIHRLAPLKEKSLALLNEFREKEMLLQQQKEDALKIASLEELRQELEDEKPCPLCGSVHHPFSAHSPKDDRPELDVKLVETRSKSIKEQEALSKINEQLTQAETQLQGIKETIKETEQKLTEQTRLLAALTSKYNGSEDLSKEHLEQKLPKLINLTHRLEEGIGALEQLRISEQLSQTFTDLKKFTETYVEIDQKRKAKFSGTDISQVAKALRERFNQSQNNITESQSALSFEQKRLEQARAQLESVETELKPMLEKYAFDSIRLMKDALISETEVNQIRQAREQLNQRITANQTMSGDLEARLKQQTESDTAPETSLESILEEKHSAKNQRDELALQQGGAVEKVRKDDQDKKLIAHKAEALELLNKELEKWSLLNKMIGDAYGNKYANFAQGLTLQNLLVYTNRRLTKLSDRYLLDKPTDDGALKVIDQYQGNSERSVTTLSGGETFLLSLALALSLSDMASKNVSLDSLFIDEGFGTLDQETLDVAMTTLERLQSESQKTVGVISHVEALKERINVQVKLQKNAQGYSTIKVEG